MDDYYGSVRITMVNNRINRFTFLTEIYLDYNVGGVDDMAAW